MLRDINSDPIYRKLSSAAGRFVSNAKKDVAPVLDPAFTDFQQEAIAYSEKKWHALFMLKLSDLDKKKAPVEEPLFYQLKADASQYNGRSMRAENAPGTPIPHADPIEKRLCWFVRDFLGAKHVKLGLKTPYSVDYQRKRNLDTKGLKTPNPFGFEHRSKASICAELGLTH